MSKSESEVDSTIPGQVGMSKKSSTNNGFQAGATLSPRFQQGMQLQRRQQQQQQHQTII
jgi:hypothetical protein